MEAALAQGISDLPGWTGPLELDVLGRLLLAAFLGGLVGLERELPEGHLKEDAELLIAQTQRCQSILRRLSQAGQSGCMVTVWSGMSDWLRCGSGAIW